MAKLITLDQAKIIKNGMDDILDGKSNNFSKALGITSNTIDITSFTNGKKCMVYLKGRYLKSILGSQSDKSLAISGTSQYFNFRTNGDIWVTSGVASSGNIEGSAKQGHYYFTVIKFSSNVSNVSGGYFTVKGQNAGNGDQSHYESGSFCVLKSRMNSTEHGALAIRLQFFSAPSLTVTGFCVIDATENSLDNLTPSQFFERYSSIIVALSMGGIHYTKCSVLYGTNVIGEYDASSSGLSKYIPFTKDTENTLSVVVESEYDDIAYATESSRIDSSLVGEIQDVVSGGGGGEVTTNTASNEIKYKPITTHEIALNNKKDDVIGVYLKKNNIKSATGIQNGNTVAMTQNQFLTINNTTKDLYASADRFWNGLQFHFIPGHVFLVVLKTNLTNSPLPLTLGKSQVNNAWVANTAITTNTASTDQYINSTGATEYFSNGYVLFTQKYDREYDGARLCFKWAESASISVTGFGILDLTDIGVDNLTAQEVFELYGQAGIQDLIEGNSPVSKVNLSVTYEGGSPASVGSYDSSEDGSEKTISVTLTRADMTLIITPVTGYADVAYSTAPALDGSYMFYYGSLSKRVYEDELRLEALEENSIVTRNKDRKHIVEAASVYGYSQGGYYRGKQFTMLIMTDVHNDKIREASVVDYSNAIKPIDAVISLGDVSPSMYYDSVDAATFYAANVARSTKPFLTTIGNHDAGISANVSTAGTKAQQFARWFEPNLSAMGLASDYDKTYYYKDFIMKHIEKINNVETEVIHSKVRVFVLDSFDAPDTLNSDDNTKFAVARDTPCFSQEQINWFIAELANVPADYTILVAMHWLPVTVEQVICNFTVKRNGAYNITGYPIVYPDLIPDIINAWKNKTTLSKTYTPVGGDYKGGNIQNCPTLVVNCNYTARTESHFACYIGGHMHTDCIAKVATYPDQYTCLLTTTCCDFFRDAQDDLPRIVDEPESVTQDAITTITIDTYAKSFKFVRIGSNRTFDLEDRTCIQIKYEE